MSGGNQGLLSEELRKSLGENVLVNEAVQSNSKKKKRHRGDHRSGKAIIRPSRALPSRKRDQRNAGTTIQSHTMSKRKRKALDKIKLEKEKKNRRKQLLESLNSNRIDDEMKLQLKSSSLIGVRNNNKKQRRENQVIDEIDSDSDESIVSVYKVSPKPTERHENKVAEKEKSETLEQQPQEVSEVALNTKIRSMAFTSKFNSFSKWMGVTEVESTGTSEFVTVQRDDQVQVTRLQLPVCRMEQEVMEAILHTPVTIVCGETGSGKTTQVPQFLVEHGFGYSKSEDKVKRGRIGVTQPRRVATVNMAKRVARELGTELVNAQQFKSKALLGKAQKNNNMLGAVGYQMRYDTRTFIPEANRIKFMTDGVLLRQAREDILLKEYSVIIIDEAHERNLNTDLLLGLLSRIILLRAQLYLQGEEVTPLRLVIMSATLKVEDFVGNNFLFNSNFDQNFYENTFKMLQNTEVEYGIREELEATMFTERERLLAQSGFILKEKFPNLLKNIHEEIVLNSSVAAIKPSVVNVENARENKGNVNIHFAKKTETNNYIEAAFKKTMAVHRKLPEGGILVFLTGQQEITDLLGMFHTEKNRTNQRIKFQSRKSGKEAEEDIDFSDIESDDDEEADPETQDTIIKEEISKKQWSVLDVDLNDDILNRDAHTDIEGEKRPTEQNTTASEAPNTGNEDTLLRMKPLGLFSRLSPEKQAEVFEPVDSETTRLIVVATNVAETSITIPGIRYVIDAGREKIKCFDQISGVSRFEIRWTSKASGEQRAGRAGRDTLEGHCYRLYSSAVYESYFEKFSKPEIMRSNIEDVVLYMKTLGIEDIVNFPFPSPPDCKAVTVAEQRLRSLGALGENMKITDLGTKIAEFPVKPRLGKILALSAVSENMSTGQLDRVIALVASLCFQPPFLPIEGQLKLAANIEEKENIKKQFETSMNHFYDSESDCFRLLKVVGAYFYKFHSTGKHAKQWEIKKFCDDYFVHEKTMVEIVKLMKQLNRILFSTRGSKHHMKVLPPKQRSKQQLTQLVTSAYLDRVARKMSFEEAQAVWKSINLLRQKAGDDPDTRHGFKLWPYEVADETITVPVFFHRGSCLFSKNSAVLPDFVVFDEIESKPIKARSDDDDLERLLTEENDNQEDEAESDDKANTKIGVEKLAEASAVDESQKQLHYLKSLTAVNPCWLLSLARGTGLCNVTVLEDPGPRYNRENDLMEVCCVPFFGQKMWKLDKQWIPVAELEEKMLSDKLWNKILCTFAFELLNQKMLDKKLSVPPRFFLKSSSASDLRVQALADRLSSLGNRNLDFRTLAYRWKTDPTFLQQEVASLVIPRNKKSFIKNGWSELVGHLQATGDRSKKRRTEV